MICLEVCERVLDRHILFKYVLVSSRAIYVNNRIDEMRYLDYFTSISTSNLHFLFNHTSKTTYSVHVHIRSKQVWQKDVPKSPVYTHII